MSTTPDIQTIIDQAEALLVTFSLEGEQIIIDAPDEADIDALIERIKAHKKELIAYLRSEEVPAIPPAPPAEQAEPSTRDDGSALYDFASVISQLVDVLGGPDKVKITQHEPGLTLEQHLRRTRKLYYPVSLPGLPRVSCPHSVLAEKNGVMVSGPCREKPLAHGWCNLHARSHELLCLGAVLGYPDVQVNEHRSIGAGVENWEGYAELAPEKWIATDIARIRSEFHYQEPLNLGIPDVPMTREPIEELLPVIDESIVYSDEELALVEKLEPYGMALTALPCRACNCRLLRPLFGEWACAACEPHGLWSYPMIARIKATAREASR